MGFISAFSRCMRDSKLSRRLSTSKQNPKRLDDDSNNLIKTTSNTLSLGRVESVSSSNTMVRDSEYELVLPTESPAHRKRLGPADLNLQTMFDNGHVLDRYNSRAAKALSMPEYPVYNLDTTRSPRKQSVKKLQAPLETENKTRRKRSTWDTKAETDDIGEEKGPALKMRWSVTGLLKKSCSLKMSRSMKRRRSTASPRWHDDSSISEEHRVHETADQKWLEANGLIGRGSEFGWAKTVKSMGRA